jgi:hypothetical protein
MLLPLYRCYRHIGAHMFSLSHAECIGAGNDEGIACYVLPPPQPGETTPPNVVAVYRFYDGRIHYLRAATSMNPPVPPVYAPWGAPEGGGAPLFSVLTKIEPGAAEFFQGHKDGVDDFFTTDPSELSGYTIDAPLGYVYATNKKPNLRFKALASRFKDTGVAQNPTQSYFAKVRLNNEEGAGILRYTDTLSHSVSASATYTLTNSLSIAAGLSVSVGGEISAYPGGPTVNGEVTLSTSMTLGISTTQAQTKTVNQSMTGEWEYELGPGESQWIVASLVTAEASAADFELDVDITGDLGDTIATGAEINVLVKAFSPTAVIEGVFGESITATLSGTFVGTYGRTAEIDVFDEDPAPQLAQTPAPTGTPLAPGESLDKSLIVHDVHTPV